MGGRPAAPGRPLTARYELDEVLARGGVGEVWRGRDLRLGRPVAVKVLHGAQADPHFRTRFRNEAQHAARLAHPNIAAVFDYGEEVAEDGDEPTPFLVMELVEGESLADLLARRGRLGVGRTLSILRQLSCALAAAHEAGVVHRDVKPANVLVRPDGVVKITDFGIAASAASASLTETGQVVGTARYLSPEQARGKRGTPASDVYALGLVGYECLAGHPAFDGPDPVEVAMKQVAEPTPPLPADVPEQVRGLVGTATAKDPARRLSDGAALRDALDRVLEGGRRAARSAVPPHGTAGYAAADAIPFPPPAAGASLLVPLAADEEPAPSRRRRWWPFLVACVLICGVAAVLSLVGLAGAAGSPDPVRARVGAATPGAPAPGATTPAPATTLAPATAPATEGTTTGATPARTVVAAPTGSGPTPAAGGRTARASAFAAAATSGTASTGASTAPAAVVTTTPAAGSAPGSEQAAGPSTGAAGSSAPASGPATSTAPPSDPTSAPAAPTSSAGSSTGPTDGTTTASTGAGTGTGG